MIPFSQGPSQGRVRSYAGGGGFIGRFAERKLDSCKEAD
jgi:hypothetical protein